MGKRDRDARPVSNEDAINLLSKKRKVDVENTASVEPTRNEQSEPVEVKESKKKKKRKHREEQVEENDPVGKTVSIIPTDQVSQDAAPKEKSKKDKDKKSRKEKSSADTQEVAVDADISTPVTQTYNDTMPYNQSSALSDLTASKVEDFLSTNFISIEDPKSTKLRPILGFKYLPSDCNHSSIFKDFKSPTPIQAATWPFLLSQRDVVGVAETGSGKTLAFGLPCVRHVRAQMAQSKKNKGVIRAVMVSPTRELAMQIYEQMAKLVANTDIKCVCIYGGMPKHEQRTELATSHIIIATPGRLNDFIQEGAADLSKVSYLVLDEADRMLDKGFEQDIRKIVGETPVGKVQMAMFTATWPQSIRELAESFMKNPVKIAIGDNPSGELRANVRVTQKVEVLDPREKEQRLLQLIKQYQSGKNREDRILIFCLYKKEAARIENLIHSRGFRVAGIHGDMNQSARTQSLDGFRDGSVPLLVATDVAARGLDIPAVKVVINVTFPLTAEDYVHRIGRTGRAGQDGLAITLFTEHDKGLSGALVNVLRAAKQPVPEELMKFGTTVKKKAHDAYGAFYKDTAGEKKATKITFD